MANADMSARGDDQPLFQALDQRLDRLEDDIAQTRKHTLELITLLSSLDIAAKPTRRNSASIKYLLRRNLYWFVIEKSKLNKRHSRFEFELVPLAVMLLAWANGQLSLVSAGELCGPGSLRT